MTRHPESPTLLELAQQVGNGLIRRGLRVAAAESCTGGLLAATCTGLPGSSDWFECSFVTYRISAKQQLLGVPRELLDRYGPVSEPVAKAMAFGALERSEASLSVAITGIAGPGGGAPEDPVGTVWFCWARVRGSSVEVVQTSHVRLEGNRQAVREGAVRFALEGLLRSIDG